MGKAPKLNLDDETVRIARALLSTPPKPHDEMKLGKQPNKKNVGRAGNKRAKAKKV